MQKCDATPARRVGLPLLNGLNMLNMLNISSSIFWGEKRTKILRRKLRIAESETFSLLFRTDFDIRFSQFRSDSSQFRSESLTFSQLLSESRAHSRFLPFLILNTNRSGSALPRSIRDFRGKSRNFRRSRASDGRGKIFAENCGISAENRKNRIYRFGRTEIRFQ